MAGLSRTRLIRYGALIPAYLASIACASASINLNILTACDEIATLRTSMIERESFAGTCRPPRSAIEKALVARAAPPGSPRGMLCIQQEAPAPFLTDFTCVRHKVDAGAALVCFRPAAISDIRTYKSQFSEKSAEPIAKYLNSAAQCRVSNGNTSYAIDTIMSGLLAVVTRFEFGYTMALGTGDIPNSLIVHGYASTNPELPGDVPSALEFVQIFTGMRPYVQPGELRKIGDWSVRLDDDTSVSAEYSKAARRQGIPIVVKSESYDLERDSGPNRSDDAKRHLLEDLQNKIAKTIEEEGFTTISDNELRNKTGKTGEQMMQTLADNMPFGSRNRMAGRVGSKFTILMNERRPACTKDGEGAMAAYIFHLLPIPQVESDYGAIQLIVVGLGECGKSRTATRSYMGGLIEESRSELLDALRRK